MKPHWWGSLTGALLAVLAGWVLLESRLGTGLVHFSYDLPFALRPHLRPEGVVLVYLDDASHKELGQPYTAPWDRALHAQLLDRLKRDGSRAVVFDIVFSDAGTNQASDEALARAIR